MSATDTRRAASHTNHHIRQAAGRRQKWDTERAAAGAAESAQRGGEVASEGACEGEQLLRK
jgi:hypothetical protein